MHVRCSQQLHSSNSNSNTTRTASANMPPTNWHCCSFGIRPCCSTLLSPACLCMSKVITFIVLYHQPQSLAPSPLCPTRSLKQPFSQPSSHCISCGNIMTAAGDGARVGAEAETAGRTGNWLLCPGSQVYCNS